MAKAWSEVAASDEYQALSDSDKNEAQNAYFDEVVAPKVSGSDVDAARSEFFAAYPPNTGPRQKFRGASVERAESERKRVAESMEVPYGDIDVSGASFMDRVKYSFADEDKEIISIFNKDYPDGDIRRITIKGKSGESVTGKKWQEPDESRIVFKYDKNDADEKWKTIEDPGLSLGDVGDVAGPAIPAAASIAVGAMTGGTSLLAQAGALGLGYAVGEAGKQLVAEELTGLDKTWKEVLAKSTIEGGKVALSAGVIGGAQRIYNMLRGGGIMRLSPDVQKDLQSYYKAKEAGLDLPNLTLDQSAPESMILNRLGKQAVSTSRSGQEHLLAQQTGAARALLNKGTITETGNFQERIGETIHGVVRSIYNREKKSLIGQKLTAKQGGRALQAGINDFVTKSKQGVSKAYQVADDRAAIEKPLFDFSNVSRKAVEIKNRVIAEGVDGEELVLPNAEGKLINIINDINKMAGTQSNYEAVKSIRTRLGDLIEDWPWQTSMNKGNAKALYGELSKTLLNPVNEAKGFTKAMSFATARARARFDILDKSHIQKIIKSDNPAEIFRMIGKPDGMADEVIPILNRYSPKTADFIRKSVQQNQMLLKESPLKTIDQWKQTDPEGFYALVSPKDESKLMAVAEKMTQLNNTSLAKVARDSVKARAVIRELLLAKDIGRSEVMFIAKNMTEQQRHLLVRGVYDDIIEKSIISGRHGMPAVNSGKLDKAILELKKNGVWNNVLSKEDRIRLQGLRKYVDLTYPKASDPGVSLEAAQAITQLKHPATFIAGAHKLSVNSILSAVLRSKAANKVVIGSGRNPPRLDPVARTALIADALLEGVDPTLQTITEESE